MVARDHRPAVGQQPDLAPAGVDHRLDRESHAGLERQAGVGLSVVQYLRVFVKTPPDAVAAILPHDAVVVGLDKALDGVTDGAQAYAGAHGADPAPHRLAGDVDQALRVRCDPSHREHARAVAVKSVLYYRHVDIDDIALLQSAVARNAVADDVIDRGADRLGVA